MGWDCRRLILQAFSVPCFAGPIERPKTLFIGRDGDSHVAIGKDADTLVTRAASVIRRYGILEFSRRMARFAESRLMARFTVRCVVPRFREAASGIEGIEQVYEFARIYGSIGVDIHPWQRKEEILGFLKLLST